MNASMVRPMINNIIDMADIKYRPVQLNLPHIFWSLLSAGDSNKPKFRSHMLFAYSIIEKLVKASRQGDLPACLIWAREIDAMEVIWAAECGGFVDPLLLPARALLNARQGDYAGAKAKLLQSIAALEILSQAGLAPAGIAALEQRLNLFRTAIMADRETEQRAELEGLIAALQRHLEVPGRSGGATPISAPREDVVAYYVDEIVFKLASVSSRALTAETLEMLAASFGRDGPVAGVGWAAALAAALIRGDHVLIGHLVTPGAPILTAPASIMLMLDAMLPRDITAPESDVLFLSVADHPARERFGITMSHAGLCPA